MSKGKPRKKPYRWVRFFSIAFAVIVFIAVLLLIFSGSQEIEITEYHPFKSMEAKERWIHNKSC